MVSKYQRSKDTIKDYYRTHRNEIAVYQKRYHALNRWTARMECIERLGGKCTDCGYATNLSALQFDHVDPLQKSFKISSQLGTQRTHVGSDGSVLKPGLRVELAKCVLRCANCHAIKSAQNGDYTRG